MLEAGVDVTSDTLVTEAAPWSSIVQRAGRCNRDGASPDARLLWVTPPPGKAAHLPYDGAELDHSVAVLAGLAGRDVTSGDLARAAQELTRPLHPVLRRRDLLDLFDTAPDLGGNDIDVSPFIRDGDDRTVSVAWRRQLVDGAADEERAPGREELCPAPLQEVRELIGGTRARTLDQTSGRWRAALREDVRPSTVIVLDAARGGYRSDHGFTPTSTAPVDPVEVVGPLPDAVDTDPLSVLRLDRWVPLGEHLADVEREARAMLDELGADELTPAQREAVTLAGRYHDLGKAHPTFVASLDRANPAHPPPPAGGPWAKSPGRAPLRHQPELPVAGALAGRPVSLAATRLGAGSLTGRALRLRDRADLGPFRLAFCEAIVRGADWRASASYEGSASYEVPANHEGTAR